jgi:dipeptidyl aminopeptidase/acylaminoacyl peptidase
MIRLVFAFALAAVLTWSGPSRAAPPPIEAYGKLPSLDKVTLSQSGDHFAFVADDNGVRRLYIATIDNKLVRAVTLGAGPSKVLSVAWAGDDFVLVNLSATVEMDIAYGSEKSELSSVVIVNVMTGKTSAVFERSPDVDHAVFGCFGIVKINGKWVGYFGGNTLEQFSGSTGQYHYVNTAEMDGYQRILSDLYQVDLESGDIHLQAKGRELNADWLLGPDGKVVVRSSYNDRTGDWKVNQGDVGGQLLASDRSKLGGVELMGLGRSGDSVIIRYVRDNDVVIQDVPLNGAAARTISDGLTADSLIVDPRTLRWIGVADDQDEPVYKLDDPTFNARVRGALNALKGYVTHLVSWNADFTRMIVYTDGGDDSGTYWMVDIAAKSAIPLGGAYPSITAKDVGPVKMVDYKAADGLAERGVLTLPPGRVAAKLPLVVMPHGGPEERDYPGFDFWAQAFASRGYAVFQPNFRGSSGYGLSFRNAGFGEWGRKMQSDISDGVSELARQGIIDPKRTCIVGASYGGYAALAGVTVQQGLYRCAVADAPVADLDSMLDYVGDEAGLVSADMRYWKKFLGMTSQWTAPMEITPTKLASRADAPILLIHGKDDTVVPIDQSDRMERALKAAGKPVERITLPQADHWMLHEDARIATVTASVAFVEKYNPPDPEPQTPPAAK